MADNQLFRALARQFSGELFYDESSLHHAQRMIYSTDASVYQEKPLAVALPRNTDDIRLLIDFAIANRITLIPRAAGTSLAGQVVGNGIVVDISKYFNRILELNVEEKWVRVQPGIIRDDLNVYLRQYGLMYAPETSTANRAMIGGMIGNNSCGLHSIVWGDARTHLIEAEVLLSDNSQATFKYFTKEEIDTKAKQDSLEGRIYAGLAGMLETAGKVQDIQNGYPKKSLTRRNTGYALDLLLEEKEKHNGGFNLCTILAGSEGTIGLITEAKLNLLPLPPRKEAVVCIHCSTLAESLHANLVALKHKPMASELVDKYIMDFTKGHLTYQLNRFFLKGDPAALLIVEFLEEDENTLDEKAEKLIAELTQHQLGYAYPVIKGEKTKLVWDIRKAGLGLIRNMPGDAQPVNLIEDCAVAPEDLPAYIEDLQEVLKKYKLTASYYAHAGAGELHVEPMINLKTQEGKETFRNVLRDTVELVKKHNGSLSGEHGDGRLRGEFIPNALGANVYALLKEMKQLFDPQNIFNANKIVDTPPMNEFLRYEAGKKTTAVKTVFDFSRQEGILKLAEKCSGSGDCRKTHITGGTMCPSYMATRREKDTTRARANILRQFLTNDAGGNPFNHQEIKEVMDLCLSCKACKSECPSSVDVAKLKAEFLQHYYEANGVPFRTWLIGNFTKTQQLAILVPALYNLVVSDKTLSGLVKKAIGFAAGRSLPTVGKTSLRKWYNRHNSPGMPSAKKVVLFCDEFTNYNDVEIGITTVKLLQALGYEVLMPKHLESGRTYLSKGLVKKAKKIINENIETLSKYVTHDIPMIGIEPSGILTFRDEALDLCTEENRSKAQHLSVNSFCIEEFLINEFDKGHITTEMFTSDTKLVKLHGHCYQKSFKIVPAIHRLLGIPQNYTVHTIPSGCCGMAGSFGYEQEHFDVSMQVGELVLFPAVRNAAGDTILAASGTSCRHQIKDGTQRKALHPVEILYQALEKR